jgi:hypothetical protein
VKGWKDEVRQAIRADEKKRLRAQRARVQGHRAETRRLVETQRSTCRAKVRRVIEVTRAEYQRAVARARARRQLRRANAREACRKGRVALERERAAELAPELARLGTLSTEERLIREAERAERRRAPRVSSRVRAQESEDEVIANIPEEWIPLWLEVGRKLPRRARMSRTEAFEHYVAEHPDEVHAAIERDVARDLEREYRARAREDDDTVPF